MLVTVPVWLTDTEVGALRVRTPRPQSLYEFCERIATAAVHREIGLGLKALETQEKIAEGLIAVNADPDGEES